MVGLTSLLSIAFMIPISAQAQIQIKAVPNSSVSLPEPIATEIQVAPDLLQIEAKKRGDVKERKKQKGKAAADKEDDQDDRAAPIDEAPVESVPFKATPAEKKALALTEKIDAMKLADTLEKAKASQALAPLLAEKAKLEAEVALKNAKLAAELADIKLETQKIEAELALATKKAELDAAKAKAELTKELGDIKHEAEKIKAANDLALAKATTSLNTYKLKEAEIKYNRAQNDFEISVIDHGIKLQAKLKEQSELVKRDEINYAANPHQGDTLFISDRRILMNGAIGMDTADYVTQRIDFYNNRDKKNPIFIVIDYNPGGSVMAGYRILKAMETSDAPVYVVVKSFAASMAACICTLAEKSFAYPNAIIMHHQMSYMMWGNMAEHKEQVDSAKEYYRRLALPIAKKMGITMDEMVEKMYEKNLAGDWEEFGDNAKKIKWVDHVVQEIRETAELKHPDVKTKSSSTASSMVEEVDAEGKRYMRLPRLRPYDAWFLHNPDGYYRAK